MRVWIVRLRMLFKLAMVKLRGGGKGGREGGRKEKDLWQDVNDELA